MMIFYLDIKVNPGSRLEPRQFDAYYRLLGSDRAHLALLLDGAILKVLVLPVLDAVLGGVDLQLGDLRKDVLHRGMLDHGDSLLLLDIPFQRFSDHSWSKHSLELHLRELEIASITFDLEGSLQGIQGGAMD